MKETVFIKHERRFREAVTMGLSQNKILLPAVQGEHAT